MRAFEYPQTTITPLDSAYPPVTLGAVDITAARPFWPLNEGVTRFLTAHEQQLYGDSPDAFMDNLPSDCTHVWGIYAEQQDRQQVMGIGTAGKQGLDTVSIGRTIFNPDGRGKRVGSHALLGFAEWLFATDSTVTSILSTTLEVNQPAIISLGRVGFVQEAMHDQMWVGYGDGRGMARFTEWRLFRPGATEFSDAVTEFVRPEQITASQQRFTQALAGVAIQRR